MAVRREERFITTLMFLYIFGVLTFYYILDPLRKGLFLQNFPASQLPYAYFLTALSAGLIAAAAFKAARKYSAIALTTGINALIIGTLFYFRWAMGRDIWYLPYVYFVYVKIVSILSTTQFWLLAGYIFDNRQAKRIYGVLGAGAATGALVGSFIPAFLSRRLTTESMISLCIAVCCVLVVLSHIAWRYRRVDLETPAERSEPDYKFSDLWRMVFRDRHLSLMVLLIFLTLIASQIADWQVDNAIKATYSGLPANEAGARIAEFSARLSFITNALSIVIQVLVAGFVVRLGILATILFLPLTLLVSSTAIFIFPAVITAAISRGSDTVSRYSINRSGMEFLYLPLSTSVRKKLKIFMDVFVDRAGRAFAGVVILLFASSVLPMGPRGAAAVSIILTSICAVICFKLRKSYVDSFREQLKRREVDLGDVSSYVSDPASVQLLVGVMEGDNERQILYSLRLLQSVRNVDFSKQLHPLFDHSSRYVREEAARTLAALPTDEAGVCRRLLDDDVPGVRHAAIDYLCTQRPAALNELLNDSRPSVRASAARWAADHAPAGFVPPPGLIENLMTFDREAAASLAARLPQASSIELLQLLIVDPSPVVAQAAARAAAKAGRLQLVPSIIAMLNTRQKRKGGRSALLLFGEQIVERLGALLVDRGAEPWLRLEAAWLLGRIPVKRSADFLVANLNAEDPLLFKAIVKALNRLHQENPRLPNAHAAISDAIYAQARAYYERLSFCRSLGAEGGLLVRAIQERSKHDIEIIFRLLALEYPSKEIHLAYLALEGSRRRASAVEYLDNVLSLKLKDVILPLLEESSSDLLMAHGERSFGIKILRRQETLQLIASRSDSWLRMCAEYEMTRP